MYTEDVISEAQSECHPVVDPVYNADHLLNKLVYFTGSLSTEKVPHFPTSRKESLIKVGINTLGII